MITRELLHTIIIDIIIVYNNIITPFIDIIIIGHRTKLGTLRFTTYYC